MRTVLLLAILTAALCGRADAQTTYAYGKQRDRLVDVYEPAPGAARPLAIYVHGGGFQSGDRNLFRATLRDALLARGFVFASVEYRLGRPFPEAHQDVTRALQWMRRHAARWRVDPRRVVLIGSSAGAGIAQWIAFHDDMARLNSPRPVEEESTRVSGVVGYGAQTTYAPADYAAMFGATEWPPFLASFHRVRYAELDDAERQAGFRASSPAALYSRGDPPALYVYRMFEAIDPGDWRTYIHHPRMVEPILAAAWSPVSVLTAGSDAWLDTQVAAWAAARVALPKRPEAGR